ncbi:metal-dependent hydrolase family protein [Marinoscillum pacificum]|uniref:metal-dependent hydrolase family protein n=1 Tax=Marinoscillum pacificum TaxID=392723 RepID=UPI002157C101|nr:amidohydrolase family protein [Marinoscillum pacificum]
MKNLIILFMLTIAWSTQAQRTLIYAGRMIDGVSDKMKTEQTIVVEDKTIVSVEEGYTKPMNGDQIIDLKNKTVMPGLIDMHVHLEGETSKDGYLKEFTMNPADIAFESAKHAKTTLMTGFTTVRDVGGSGVNISLRNAINKGLVVGPRIYTSGKSLAITGGHADPTNGYREDLMGDPSAKDGVVNSVEDARKAVRQRYKNGADLIKITATGGVLSVAKDGVGAHFSQEEMDQIVKTASDLGFHVAAHAHGDEGMQRAVKAGVKTIEHGTYMSEETMKLMKEHGAYYIPTITAGMSVAELAKIDGYYPAMVAKKAAVIGPQISSTFSKAYKMGVPIGFGTDAAVYPHGENYKEFIYMVAGGMPAMEAIKCATSVNAEILGKSDLFGSLKKGLMADIIAVDGNPLEQIDDMGKVSFVMKEGVVYMD